MSINENSHSKPLVSVITPCYNAERFMAQWADNLVTQDYPNVEIIFVNDGSTDGSAAAFAKERERLCLRGYSVHYVEKPNGGAADAVNHGLALVSGAYIMLLDMDDILFPENISAKADFLTEHDDIDLVRNSGYAVNERNLNDRSCMFGEGINGFNPSQIDVLLGTCSILPYPGSYMVRAGALFARLKNRKIYVTQYGQNVQILITVAYYGKAGYIDRPLMVYVHYKKSSSHTRLFQRCLELYNGYEDNIINTLLLLGIPDNERQKHINTVKKAHFEGRFMIGIEYKRRKLIVEQYKLMKEHGLVTKHIKRLFFLSHLPLGCFAIKSYPRAQRVCRRFLYRIGQLVRGK